jgi:hypothetical protein
MRKRNTKFEDLPENWADVLLEVGREGGMNVHFQNALNISRRKYDEFRKEHEDFAEVLEEAKQLSEQWWVEKAVNAFEGEKSKMFNQHLWGFIMKNRFPYHWKDKTDIDVTTNGKDMGGPIQIEILKSQDKSES